MSKISRRFRGGLIGIAALASTHVAFPQAIRWRTVVDDVSQAWQWGSAVRTDSTGRAVIAGQGIGTARFDVDGTLLWEQSEIGDAELQNRRRIAIGPNDAVLSIRSVRSGSDNSSADIEATKLDPSGTSIWRHVIDVEDGYDLAHGIVATSDGGALILSSTLHASLLEIYVEKIGAGGDRAWSRRFPYGYGRPPFEVRTLALDSIMVCAYRFDSELDSTRIELHKLSPDGETLWQTQYPPAAESGRSHVIESMAIGPNGRAWVLGVTERDGTQDLFVAQFTADGLLLSSEVFSGRPAEEAPTKIVSDGSDGAVAVAVAQIVHGGQFEFRCLTVRYGPSGARLWTRTFPDSQAVPIDLARLTDGRFAVLAVEYAGGSSRDPLVLTVNLDGSIASSQLVSIPGGQVTEARAIAASVDGGYAVTGRANALGDDHAFVANFASDGTFLGHGLLNHYVPSRDGAGGLALDGLGNVFTCGWSPTVRPEDGSMVVVKHDSEGSEQWRRHDPAFMAYESSVVADGVGGAIHNGQRINEQSERYETSVRYDSNGQVLWTNACSAAADDCAQIHGGFATEDSNTWLSGVLGYRLISPEGQTLAAMRLPRPSAAGRWTDLHSAPLPGGGAAQTATWSTVEFPAFLVAVVAYAAEGEIAWQNIHRTDLSRWNAALGLAVNSHSEVTLLEYAAFPGTRVVLNHFAPNGTLLWQRTTALPWYYWQYGAVAVGPDDRIVTAVTAPGEDSAPAGILVACLDREGAVLWERRVTGGFEHEPVREIVIDEAGNAYVSSDAWTVDQLAHGIVRRFERSGRMAWRFGVDSGVQFISLPLPIAGIALDPLGGLVIAGTEMAPGRNPNIVVHAFSPAPANCLDPDCAVADTNGDCVIDLADLGAVLSQFGGDATFGIAPANGDLDFDRAVTLQDLALVLAAFGEDCR